MILLQSSISATDRFRLIDFSLLPRSVSSLIIHRYFTYFFRTNGDRQISTSDLDSEEENEEGDYTVYECPGLAPVSETERRTA